MNGQWNDIVHDVEIKTTIISQVVPGIDFADLD